MITILVPDYETAFPRPVDDNGNFKRSETRHPNDIRIKSGKIDFKLKIHLNKKLIPENAVVEVHDGKTVKRLMGVNGVFSTGKVTDDPHSIVALDHSNGLVSFNNTLLPHNANKLLNPYLVLEMSLCPSPSPSFL